MEPKKQKKTKSTQTTHIATDNITPNPEATAAVVAGSISEPPGSKAAAQKLLKQAGRSLELVVAYAVAFAARDYTDRDVQGLKDDRSAFDEAWERAQAARKAAKASTAQHQAVVGESVVFRDELVSGLRDATLGKANPLKNPKLMLSRTTEPEKLALWFRSVANEVQDNQAALSARFAQDAVALLKSKTEQLDAANGAQLTAREITLPAAVRAQQAAQVKLAASIARVRFVAGMAFARDKEVLKLFVPAWSPSKNRASKAASGDPASGSASSTAAGSSGAGALPAGSAPAGTAPAGSAQAGSGGSAAAGAAGSAPAGSAGLLPAGSTSPSTETAASQPAAHADAKSAS